MLNIKARFFVILLFSTCLTACISNYSNCTANWKITGYYTPTEADFKQQDYLEIKVKNSNSYQFPKSFIETIKVEGWGKTLFGWYLGFYSQQWHQSSAPLDSKGHSLSIGTVAVDNRIVSKGQNLSVPGIKGLLKTSIFIASDVGSAVKGKHLDIYTGEGKAAQKLTYDITGVHNVCLH